MAQIPSDLLWQPTGDTIGQGGQAQIVPVRCKDVGRFPSIYAMKILRNVDSDQAKARFHREIEAVKDIHDERIVRILDSHREGADFLYYVMEYDPLRIALDKLVYTSNSPFLKNPQICLEFIAQCAEALVPVHEKAIVHRDLQPKNILFHPETMSPLIIDFGCCHCEGDETITLTDEGVGTRDYIAPECEHGGSGNATSQSDLYSLGKLLWVLVSGKKVFARENPAFTTRNLQPLLPDHPQCWHLTRIFEKTIRRDPKKRYKDAKQFASECRRFANLIVGKYAPLELAQDACPVCGSTAVESQVSYEHEVQLFQVFGNPMPSGTYAHECKVCGFLSAWNRRPMQERKKSLESME